MNDNVFPFSISLSTQQLTLFSSATGVLSATVLHEGQIPEDPIQVTFGGSDTLELSSGDGHWGGQGVSPETEFVTGTASALVRVRAGAQSGGQIEVRIPGRSNPAYCRVTILEDNAEATREVASLVYVSGSNQFGWDAPTDRVFSSPLIVRAMDRHGEPVPGARVTFRVNTSSAAMSSDWQYTDEKGETRSAFLIAQHAGTESFIVTAECNGQRVDFSGLAVAPGSLKMELDPVEISVGRTQEINLRITGNVGESWEGLPCVAHLERGSQPYFVFTGDASDGGVRLWCDAKGLCRFEVRCQQGTSPGQEGLLTVRSGPSVRSIILTAKDA